MEKTLEKVEVGDSIWKKTFGVMFWKDFGELNGLLLTSTNGIHTFFVRFPIDVAFLNKNQEVIRLVKDLKPWSFSPIIFSAKHTLEMPSGSIKKYNLAIGDKLILK